jgi:hypothetical protein
MGKWKVFCIEVADGQGKAVIDRLASRAKKLKLPIRGILKKGQVDIYILLEATDRRDVMKLTRGVKGVKHLVGGQRGRALTEAYGSSGRDLEEFNTEPDDYFTDVLSTRG